MKMTKIFLDWAIAKFPNDIDLGKVFREFYNLAKEGGNTGESGREAEEQIMTKYFN